MDVADPVLGNPHGQTRHLMGLDEQSVLGGCRESVFGGSGPRQPVRTTVAQEGWLSLVPVPRARCPLRGLSLAGTLRVTASAFLREQWRVE